MAEQNFHSNPKFGWLKGFGEVIRGARIKTDTLFLKDFLGADEQ